MIKLISFGLLTLVFSHCKTKQLDSASSALTSPVAERASDAGTPGTWMNWDKLPETDQWKAMYQLAQDVAEDLNTNAGKGKYQLVPKDLGGSSVYTFVMEGERILGLWAPPSAAGRLSGEIAAFNLARLFGHSNWAAPATRMTLSEKAVQYFMKETAGFPRGRCSSLSQQNACAIDQYYKVNKDFMVGMYKWFDPSLSFKSLTELVNTNTNDLNTSHKIAQFNSKNGPQPSNNAVYLLPLGKDNNKLVFAGQDSNGFVAQSTEIEVAKQLNHMMVVDVINSQRDRYGNGSNMNLYLNKGTKSFALILGDNGGGNPEVLTSWRNKILAKITRFDRPLAQDILDMNDFVKGNSPSFKGFTNIDDLRYALGYEDSPKNNPSGFAATGEWARVWFPYGKEWNVKWGSMLANLDALAAHIRANQNWFQ